MTKCRFNTCTCNVLQFSFTCINKCVTKTLSLSKVSWYRNLESKKSIKKSLLKIIVDFYHPYCIGICWFCCFVRRRYIHVHFLQMCIKERYPFCYSKRYPIR